MGQMARIPRHRFTSICFYSAVLCLGITCTTYIFGTTCRTSTPIQYEAAHFKNRREIDIQIILEDHQYEFSVVSNPTVTDNSNSKNVLITNPEANKTVLMAGHETQNKSALKISSEKKVNNNAIQIPEIKKTHISAQHRPKEQPAKTTQKPLRSKMFLNDIPLEMGFQPYIDVEFPSVESDTHRIPHNIHQIWMRVPDNSSTPDMAVPDKFVKYMETFPKFNPDWTYYFWTYNTSRKLLQDRHPELLHFFDNTTELVVRADLMRYVVLYEFGGLYADLDTTCLRPLDIVTKKYTCILVLAPFENAAMMLNGPYQICNGEIFCRARHPFLRYVLNTIANKADAGKGAFVIGPSFFTGQYRLYNNISKEDAYRIDIFADTGTPYFYKGERPVTDDDGIYIANTRYFLDQPHPTLRGGIKKRCSNQTNESSVRKRMCAVVETMGFDRNPGKFAFLTHAYSFSFSAAAQNQTMTYIPVEKVIPKFDIYDMHTGLVKTVYRSNVSL
ncbi:uncharacterized protein LOC127836551 [Dreissena polymorpha]|uniref:Uncharacterized protein n=1 Tax=Dreissena polymorpha TaxID=45954 RepID=A0A9D4MUV8_DREPO|nr:uncharacterized protein LOC127836551 [Dreissena polymorpha]KAH3884208.1 hypothetical protein DPMN_008183 [Dreissena polymorpha]